MKIILLVTALLLGGAGSVLSVQPRPDPERVYDAAIEYYEALAQRGKWSKALSYFDAHQPPQSMSSAEETNIWERYLFTGASLHLQRSSDSTLPTSGIVTQAKKAEEACLAYVKWFEQVEQLHPEWLLEVSPQKGQDDPPLSRARIRHILGLMTRAILTQGFPKRVSAALEGYPDLWFGYDAVRGWADALSYQFSNSGPWPKGDAERIAANLQRGFIDMTHVQSFAAKLNSIAQKREQAGRGQLSQNWMALKEILSTVIVSQSVRSGNAESLARPAEQ